MPRVPTYDAPRVQQAPLRGGENTTRAIDLNAGAAMTGVGKAVAGLGEVGDRIQERRDLDAAFRVETKVLSDFSQFEQNLRKTRRGATATGVVDDVDQWWSKIEESYGKDVSPRVKELTAKSLARARAQSLESISRYQMAEEDRAQTESYSAVNGTEIQRAITTGTPEALAGAKAKIDAAVSVFGATRGWTPEQLTAEKQKWNNTLHTQAVGNLVDSNPRLAKEYFEANRSEIDSANHARFTKIIDRAVAEDNATKSAAQWASLPFEKAIENANKITDPDERKLTIAAVRDLQADKNMAMQLRERDASDKVWQMVASGVPMKRLPRAVLEQMNGRERVQVNAYYEAEQRRREAEAKGSEVKTDPAVYGAVLDRMREDPQGTRPETFNGLSRSDIRSLQNHRDSLLNKNPGAEKEVASTEQHMGTYLATMKLKDEDKGMFQKTVYDALEAYRQVNKKEADYETRAKIMDRASMEISIPGRLFGSTEKRAYEMDDKDRVRYLERLPEDQLEGMLSTVIPASDLKRARQVLADRGLPITARAVRDVYLMAKNPPKDQKK